jgi:DNA adenine methylase
VRDRFNKKRTPEDLLFLSRTCVNGLIRFNAYGDFNNSLHHTRPGIHPETLRSILLEWSKIVSKTKFAATDYENLLKKAKLGDIVYMDPPYNTGRNFYYFQDKFADFPKFMEERIVECHRILKKNGNIIIHVEPRISHHIRIICDKIFGESLNKDFH